METIPGSSPELSLGSELITGDDGINFRNLVTDNELPSSVYKVLSDDDLVIEILLRLPILSLLFFKSVSKHWLSLIRHINSTLRMTKNPHLDPPTGLFIRRLESPSHYDFVSLDSKIPSRIYPLPFSFNFRLNSKLIFNILDSCNGLLLCEGVNQDNMIIRDTYCVYNPSVNMFKMLPKCHDPNMTMVKPVFKLAFDPRKSPHYKIVLTAFVVDGYQKIETYCSETGRWSVCSDRYAFEKFLCFEWGRYWDHAIHWLDNMKQPVHFKLDIKNDHPVLSNIQLPETVDKKNAWECKLFESCGSLLLGVVDYAHSQELHIYKMFNGSSEWSMKYSIKLDDIAVPFPDWGCSVVWSIVLGDREEDSFLVINLDNKVVQYKFLSKNHRTLYLESTAHVSTSSRFQFFTSFAGV